MLQIGTRPTLKLCIFRAILFFYRYFPDSLLKAIFANLLIFSLENDISQSPSNGRLGDSKTVSLWNFRNYMLAVLYN